MPHPDEGLIHAWLDGELDAAESARIEALVRSDPAWATAVAEARGLVAASSRIVTALDHVGGVTQSGGAMRPGEAARRRRPWWMMRAAALLVVVAGTAIVLRRSAPEETLRPALDEALRPAPAPMAPIATAPTSAAARGKEPPASAPAPAKVAGEADRRAIPTEPKATAPLQGRRDAAASGASAAGVPVAGAPVVGATVAGARVGGAKVAGPPVVAGAPVAGAAVAGVPAAAPEGRFARAAETDTALKALAKDEQMPRVTCYEIVDSPALDRDNLAQRKALAAQRTIVRVDSLTTASARKVLALEESADRFRFETAEFAGRPSARAPAAASPRIQMPGLLRRESPDTLVVTWREAGQAMTARAAARGDTLVGSASAGGTAPRAFRAVRTPCPNP